MSTVAWYYAKNDQQFGPVTGAELRQLAVAGQITPDDLVWREGLESWIEARRVKGLLDTVPVAPSPQTIAPPPAAMPAPAVALPPQSALAEAPMSIAAAVKPSGEAETEEPWRHPFDVLLDAARDQLDAAFVAGAARLFTLCGHYGLCLAMLLLLAIHGLAAARAKSGEYLFLGLAWVVALVVLQYTAVRFLKALEQLNRTTSGKIPSTAFADSLALASLVLGLAGLIGLAAWALYMQQLIWLVPALASFILLEYLAAVAVNPAALNVKLSPEAGAGDEAMGNCSLLVKAIARAVPVAYGVGVAAGCIQLLLTLVNLVSPPQSPSAEMLDMADAAAVLPQLAVLSTFARVAVAAQLLAVAAALPLAAYGFFLVYHLLIDVVQSVLALPRVLERLAPEEPGDDPDG